MGIKWIMNNPKSFTAEKDGYIIQVNVAKPPRWHILKDNIIIDECYHYSPTKCELSARVQAEKALKIILANKGIELEVINKP